MFAPSLAPQLTPASIPSFLDLCELCVSAFSFSAFLSLSLDPPTFDFLLLSPFSATHTGTPQLIENTTTLSLVFATLTSRVKHKSFICHSYRKTPGVGVWPQGMGTLKSLKESAGSCVLSIPHSRQAPATPSNRPSPNSPGSAKSTTRATATSCGDRAVTPETPHEPQSTRPSAPLPSRSSASISPVGTQFSFASSPPLRPASDPAAQSASSTGPASSRFLSRSYRNSSPVSLARSTFPSC